MITHAHLQDQLCLSYLMSALVRLWNLVKVIIIEPLLINSDYNGGIFFISYRNLIMRFHVNIPPTGLLRLESTFNYCIIVL